jgi:hypothetical protein
MNGIERSATRRTLLTQQDLLNGIDYLEVADLDPAELNAVERTEYDSLAASEKGRLLWQRRLNVFLVNPLKGNIVQSRISIEGGERIRNLRVVTAVCSETCQKLLLVTVDRAGDFSRYTLHIAEGAEGDVRLDPVFSSIDFSFKAGCPSDFDCRKGAASSVESVEEPHLDYLAKDYASFRQLMLDRMSLKMPGWQERHAADLGVTLVELLAWVGDRLSYRQDAVATEAYLGTARRRVSVRRHARLLDYRMHDGCNARVLVQITAQPGIDGYILPGASATPYRSGTRLVTGVTAGTAVVTPDAADAVAAEGGGVEFFETLHDLTLYEAHNEMEFYTFCQEEISLPKGATSACLAEEPGRRLALCCGDLLFFVEREDKEVAWDPTHVHTVRLTAVRPEAEVLPDGRRKVPAMACDPLFPNVGYVEIEWGLEDALPFPLAVRRKDSKGDSVPVAVALGNIVLADHGQSVSISIPEGKPSSLPGPVTQQGAVPSFDSAASVGDSATPSASSLFSWEMREVKPCVRLAEEYSGITWQPRQDLLGSDRFARDFVVEIEEGGTAQLRFGGNGMGAARPEKFVVHYRIGNGTAGNVGARTIVNLVAEEYLHLEQVVREVSNPLPAKGGTEAESIAQVRHYASQAFRRQERAVSAADYAAIAERHPEVQKASASIRWTGSWHTIFVTVDRLGGKPDSPFLAKIKKFLEWYRMAGYDIEVCQPRYVSLDILLEVTTLPGYLAAHLKEAILASFGSGMLPDGRRGFFHPDNFTFGDAVYVSRIYAAALALDGVASVQVTRLQRFGKGPNGEISQGRLSVGMQEIVRLDNNSNYPERGSLEVRVSVGEGV